MSIKITLRRNIEFSPFRKQLLEICSFPIQGNLILCSGYIWEGSTYSVLNDDLLAAIKKGLCGNKIICVAGKLQTKPVNWVQHYKDFVNKISSHGISVEAKVAPRRNWHAKIAIRMNSKNQPIVAIVGSSNLTGPAFGENRYAWNYECDVTLWSDKEQWDHVLDNHTDQTENDPFTSIETVLDPNKPNQPDIDERLNVLVEDIYRDSENFVDLTDYNGE